MATRKKKTVADETYSKLDHYCIQLNEYYRSLRKAGFSVDNSLWLLSAPETYPDWIKEPSTQDIINHMEDEDE